MQVPVLLLGLCVLGLLVPHRLRASMLSSVTYHLSVSLAQRALLSLHNVHGFPQSFSSIICTAFLLIIILWSGLDVLCSGLPKGFFIVHSLSVAAPHGMSACLGNCSPLLYLTMDGLLWAATNCILQPCLQLAKCFSCPANWAPLPAYPGCSLVSVK